MLKILDIKYRKEPIQHTKLQHFEEKNNIVKRKSKKLYDYYICDYCGSEIRLDIKQTERSRRNSDIAKFINQMRRFKSCIMQ